MMPENNWYGHKLAFAWFLGNERAIPIFGTVPHGWGPDLPASRRRIASAPLLLWNERHLRQAAAGGVVNARCIGAPFGYLVRTLWPSADYPGGRGTLVFPSHSSEGLQENWDVLQFISDVEEAFEPPYTVSVFYQDLGDARTALYREAGWRLVTFGSRREPTFLLRLALELSSSRAVVGNVMQTSLLYGALLGRYVRVLGPGATWVDTLSNPWNIRSAPTVWPDLHNAGLAPHDARALGEHELGWSANLAREELAEALGWRSLRRRVEARLISHAIDARLGAGARRGEFA